MQKHTGELPIIGVNTFRNPHGEPVPEHIELARSTEEEKQSQLQRLAAFQAEHATESPAMLQRLQSAVIANDNVFEVLMDAVRCCSLGQITHALFEVGGQYRRSIQDRGRYRIAARRFGRIMPLEPGPASGPRSAHMASNLKGPGIYLAQFA
eukprot:gene16603-22519_t